MTAACDASDTRTNAVPLWHPLALIALMLAVAITGLFFRNLPNVHVPSSGSRIARAYLPMLSVSWGLLLYVCRIGRSRVALAELAGIERYSLRRLLGDVALACGVAAALLLGEFGWQLVFGHARSASVAALLPVTPLERVVWCGVAVSAALSEEVVYRGYLIRELARLGGGPLIGVLGQALLFALAHGEQGVAAMFRFFLYACGLALLALRRRSLVPGILGHAAVDLIAGLTA